MISDGVGSVGVKYHNGMTTKATRIARCASTETDVVSIRVVAVASERWRVIVSTWLRPSRGIPKPNQAAFVRAAPILEVASRVSAILSAATLVGTLSSRDRANTTRSRPSICRVNRKARLWS